jgi:hypothetical protein
MRLLPPYEEDLELSWQLRPEAWGSGYASEAGGVKISTRIPACATSPTAPVWSAAAGHIGALVRRTVPSGITYGDDE